MIRCEEITCGDGTPVRSKEFTPRHLPRPTRRRIESVIFEDLLDRCSTDLVAEAA